MPSISTDKLLQVAKTAVSKGSDITKRYFDTTLKFDTKAGNHTQIVSKADREAEQAIFSVLKSSFPNHNFIGEEGMMENNNSDYTWSADPIDGTICYAFQLPWFCVSLGLLYRHQPLLSVIIIPFGLDNKTETFVAISGQGAFCNDRKLVVRKTANLKQALCGWNYSPPLATEGTLLHHQSSPNFLYTVCIPSAIYILCLLARGKLDAFWDLNLEHWDIAATTLLVAEAGGKVTDIKGNPLNWSNWQPGQKFSFAASNTRLHDQLIQTLS